MLQDIQRKLNNEIHLVLASDDNYVHHLAVVIASVLMNLSEDYYLQVYVLDDGIKEDSKKKLKELKVIKDFNIEFIEVNCDEYDFFKGNKSQYISRATFARLKLPLLLSHLDKCIYLDCDLVARKDLSELWNIDLGPAMLGAVENPGCEEVKTALKMPKDSGYFNAGVIVFDLKKLREFDLPEKAMTILKENDNLTYADQDVLNLIFCDQWYTLDVKWNAIVSMYLLKNIIKYYKSDIKKVNVDLDDPVIVHYTQARKGDSFLCEHPFRKDYLKYKKLTQWKDLPMKDVSFKSILIRILWFFKNIFRKFPFLFLFLRNVKRKLTGFQGSILR